MRKVGVVWALVLIPLAVALFPGCGPSRVPYPPVEDDTGGGGAAKKGTQELASKGWGTLKGRITYDGQLPANAPYTITKDHNVLCECEEAKIRKDNIDQVWVGKEANGVTGVGNVVVFLKPPAGKHFKIPDELKDLTKDADLAKKYPNLKKEEVLDQPFCAYEPRVVVLYLTYSDGTEPITTGQSFKIKNSAPVPHNTKIKGNPLFNRDFDSGNISSNTVLDGPPLKGQYEPLNVSCDIHGWMKGVCWSFDHPYSAKTNLDGTFEIKNVPAGAELGVVVWHEGIGFHSGDGFEGKRGKAFNFKAGETEELNVKIKKQ